jgi:3-hydroxyisobutyrate dehydrogenase-like beta-hydroxyacid dehydrogenase
MTKLIGMLGFGEAGAAFASCWTARARAYDRKTDDPVTCHAKQIDLAAAGVERCDVPAQVAHNADAILSLVTADQAVMAVRSVANAIAPGALYLDGNSVAPDTKRAAAALIEERGGCYIDVAVMAPVNPKRCSVPLLLSGAGAKAAATLLRTIGFDDVSVASDAVGTASAIKMIRSVMIKGIEALSAECVLAAEASGVREAVVASLDASWPGANWAARFDYNLDRMIVHGARRAAEMEEVVVTLDALSTGSAMSRATAVRQRLIGALQMASPEGLDAKLLAIKEGLAV